MESIDSTAIAARGVRWRRARRGITVLAAAAALAGVSLSWAQPHTASPLSPQPDPAAMKPGLAVNYIFTYFEHISELKKNPKKGKRGEPLLQLKHNTREGNVLTADRPMGVGARIRGMINLSEQGLYVIRIQSNDGVELRIGGQRLWYDPEIHANRWSKPIEFQADQPGWYALEIDYYQKKGTSALQLKWTPPGGTEAHVPAEALAHIPG